MPQTSRPNSLSPLGDICRVGALAALALLGLLAVGAPCCATPRSYETRDSGKGPKATRVEGSVKDKSGAAISGATVIVESQGRRWTKETDSAGQFSFEGLPHGSGTIRVAAPGFADAEQSWVSGDAGLVEVTFELVPVGASEQISVAARTPVKAADVPGAVVVLARKDLKEAAPLTLDDVLREIPGFNLFRRSGSRTTNPTSQGVSLRGVGASGASRATVLLDGVPLSDPFGGWIYWDRVPRESIERVEVLEGAGSNLYGSDAMGGVISVERRNPAGPPSLLVESSYGNEDTPEGSLSANEQVGSWSGRIGAAAFKTDGYVIVDPTQRGRVDTQANSQYATLDATIERSLGTQGRVFGGASIFGEERGNGTLLQTNRTHIRQLEAGADWSSRAAGTFSVRAYGSSEIFDQNFSSVSSDRRSETLTRLQRVPVQQEGLSVQWTKVAGDSATLVAGFDAREVRGSSNEVGYSSGAATSATGAGGRQRVFAVFGQDMFRLGGSSLLTIGLRFDRWSNYDALSVTRPLTGPANPAVKDFLDREESAVSPKIGFLQRITSNIALFSSVYQAFRAPTLNELYRSFRLGNIVTNANQTLKAERLAGGEAGATWFFPRLKLRSRGVFFWNEISRPIANVTLAIIPNPLLIIRQRQNLGNTLARGVEAEATAQITRDILISGRYQFSDSRVLSFAANPSLAGRLIPEVPRNEFTFDVVYFRHTAFSISAQGRFVGNEFDDDANTLLLGQFFTLDLIASKPIGGSVEVFGAVENVLNEKYTVALTPTRTIGAPILGRVGVRLRIGAR